MTILFHYPGAQGAHAVSSPLQLERYGPAGANGALGTHSVPG